MDNPTCTSQLTY